MDLYAELSSLITALEQDERPKVAAGRPQDLGDLQRLEEADHGRHEP